MEGNETYTQRVLEHDGGELAKYVQFMTMPLFYQALVVESTTRCNAKCAMCYQSAGPKGSDVLGAATLETEDLARLLLEAAEIESIYPRFHLSGGEAFLDINNCLQLFRVARTVGFLDITTTTNAYWARREERAKCIASQAKEAGLTGVEISWDIWHLPYIDPMAVGNCIRACREVEIEVNLRLLSTKSHTYQEALQLLPDEAVSQANRITCGPVFPTGRASRSIPPSEFHVLSDSNLEGNCHSLLNLTVNPLGDVYPCCAGLDHTGARLFGNIRQQPLASIVASMNSSPLLRTLVLGGVSWLRPILETAGFHIGSDYQNICHMCWSIFSDPGRVRYLKS